MADTQRQRGARVRLQNTAQQIRLHTVLLFWFKTDLRSDLRALNCVLRENAPRPPLDPRGYARIRHSARNCDHFEVFPCS